MPLVGKDTSQHRTSEVPPVQRDIVQHVVLQDAVCEDVLQDGRRRQKKAEHQEQEKQGREVAIFEGFQGDVRMPADNHPVDAEGQRENGNQGTEEDLQGIEPVVEPAIFEHEDDRQQEDGPQGASQPVNAEQGQRFHEPEVAGKGRRESPQHEQQSHDEPVHRVPVAPVAQVDGEQA